MHRAMPAFRTMIEMRKDREIRAILLQRSQRLTDRKLAPLRRREESARPETEMIADANQTSWISLRHRSREADVETIKNRKREGNAKSPKEMTTINDGGGVCFHGFANDHCLSRIIR